MKRLTLSTVVLAALWGTACTDSPLTAPDTGFDAEPSFARLGSQRVTVCHVDDTGAFAAIRVAPKALAAHLRHGDGQPGEAVPGNDGYVFDDGCAMVSSGHSISGVAHFAGTATDGLRVDLVATPTPTLEWSAFEGAATYSVQINETLSWDLLESIQASTNSYELQESMSLGVLYTWQVDAYDADGHWIGTTTDAFDMTYFFLPPGI